MTVKSKVLCKKIYKKAVQKYGTREVNLGIKIEKEHGGDFCKSLKVTMDHLDEYPNYNSQLIKFEKVLKKGRRL